MDANCATTAEKAKHTRVPRTGQIAGNATIPNQSMQLPLVSLIIKLLLSNVEQNSMFRFNYATGVRYSVGRDQNDVDEV